MIFQAFLKKNTTTGSSPVQNQMDRAKEEQSEGTIHRQLMICTLNEILQVRWGKILLCKMEIAVCLRPKQPNQVGSLEILC